MVDMTEYQSLYMEELDEQLQLMEEEILRFEKSGQSLEGIQRLFRAAHTLKGSSAAMGYEKMKQLTHNMEHILEQVRNSECSLTLEMATLFFRCVDRMKELRSEIASSKQEISAIDDLIAELRKEDWVILNQQSEQLDYASQLNLSDDDWQSLNRRVEGGERIFWVRVRLQDQCEMRTARFHVIESLLGELATVVWSEKAQASENEAETTEAIANWLVISSEQQEILDATIKSWFDVDTVQLRNCSLSELAPAAQASDSVNYDDGVNPVTAPAVAHPEKSRVQSIRVNVDRLEQLMNLVGELVIDQTRIKQMEKELTTKFGVDDTVQDLGQLSDHFTRIIGELQESVMKVRMLPIEQLFNRFPRMIRDLSQSLDKEVELVLEGKETELDRTLIEEIGDPLIHLIRNAIDHGIEAPSVRRNLGKPDKGKLLIRASHEDNQVLIVVEDDGAGIDTQRLLQKAVSRGIITSAEAELYSHKEAIDLIFHPGLSTASQVSDVSGRGVGMDIVRAGIEKMNGRIEIDTVIGKGTSVKIRLPLTLAIITGLMVKISDSTFVIPMSNVAEIVRIEPEAIRYVKGVPIVTIRDQVTPLVWLHDCLGYPKQTQGNRHIPVVIIGRAEKRYALAVDELLGNQEIVIKSLGAFVGQVEGVAGATILGNGKVALILEVGGIIRMMGRA
ncbi:chemotaxis protein CheA [Cohnella silvisoli]|uniref:Chemotaxis protein CheA n=1 Tax=Cohnella silvisoli TaxID=2873699 RepID=A0ABV1KQY1_9BACL|nr:chemotaxis protein CheA [Cohnella silvisoli]MCD9024537.1 chemotaxis protein CheA [Cohnella silvisoli]